MIFDGTATSAATLHARDDAFGGKALLSGGAGGHRRRAVREVPAADGGGAEAALGGLAALAAARDRREPLDLDLPERKILLDEAGRVERIVIPERLDAHRLIEES